jgi:hypothetical protein
MTKDDHSRHQPRKFRPGGHIDTSMSRPALYGLRERPSRARFTNALARMPIRRLPRSPASLFLRSPSGMSRRSSPSSSRRSKAYSIAPLTAPRRWSASKIATPSGPQTTALAVQGERRAAESSRRADDRRIALAPVVAAPREQAHLVALTPHLQPISVVLDLVHPSRPRRHSVRAGGHAGIDESRRTHNRNHALSYRLLRLPGKCQSVAQLSPGRTLCPGKRVRFGPYADIGDGDSDRRLKRPELAPCEVEDDSGADDENGRPDRLVPRETAVQLTLPARAAGANRVENGRGGARQSPILERGVGHVVVAAEPRRRRCRDRSAPRRQSRGFRGRAAGHSWCPPIGVCAGRGRWCGFCAGAARWRPGSTLGEGGG